MSMDGHSVTVKRGFFMVTQLTLQFSGSLDNTYLQTGSCGITNCISLCIMREAPRHRLVFMFLQNNVC